MFKKFYRMLWQKLYSWLSYEPPAQEIMPYDYNRLKYELKPGDVLLIEGRSRVSRVIRTITQSPWTHAALYIGRINDFEEDEITPTLIRNHTTVKDNTRLIVEDLIDAGTVITPLQFYRNHHIRICRPIGISPEDKILVINYALKALGQPYNMRHLLDLARFLLPWSILPRRLGSSLFRSHTGKPESSICSSLIAEAFESVQFPILPFMRTDEKEGIELFQRNPYLFTPKDFDYSPYFEIIKYPLFNPDEPLPYYRRLPWTKTKLYHQDQGMIKEHKAKTKKSSKIITEAETVKNPETNPNSSSEQKDKE